MDPIFSPMIWEWISLSLRWLHVIAGIAWIGSSFYFVHLDSSLRKANGLPEGVGGEAWQVHGGGFYRMQKYLVAPADLPDSLTWFKWEAYTTWISGFFLMGVVYYANADLYMIDPTVLALPPWAAILISLAALALGWVGYDALCKSPVGRNDMQLIAVGFVILVIVAWLFTLVFSGRGAFLQVGALIGTMMVANVAMVIIPNQKKVVAAMMAGQEPDPTLGEQAKQRSMHNNYLTLPVLFLMISNHYPLSFASRWNWLIIAIILIVGAVIRHFYNERHAGRGNAWWTWAVAAAGMLLVVWLGTARPVVAEDDEAAAAEAAEVDFAEVENTVLGYCSMCHAEEPLWEGLASAPKGVMLDDAERIRLNARKIYLQAVRTHAMPPPGAVEMGPEDRALLAAWYEAGAPMQ
jgi:uncharacterized membrane protein